MAFATDTFPAPTSRRLVADAIHREDAGALAAHNLTAPGHLRFRDHLGPLPFEGSIATAPIVLLDLQPPLADDITREDYAFEHAGWPLAALHPDAPPGLRRVWESRLGDLRGFFGAQHLANSIVSLHLVPWAGAHADEDLRLPSRERMLSLAAHTARRGAFLVFVRGEEQWIDDPDVASSLPSRRCRTRSQTSADMSVANLGTPAWDVIRMRIAIHDWQR